MKIYIASRGEYEDNDIIGIYDNWQSAYDTACLEEHYAIEIWHLETNKFLEYCWITCFIDEPPFRFEFTPDYRRDIDPTEVQR
jgi:hypothetical protein